MSRSWSARLRGAPPPGRARPLRQNLADGLAAAVSWLPVLLMGLLALATWWLVRSTPVPEADRDDGPPRGEPDYTMERFVVQRFDPEGRLRARIEGDRMRHFPDTDRLEIEQPRVLSIDEAGRRTEASALGAIANGDGTEVALAGQARVRREGLNGEPAIEFEGEALQASRLRDRIEATRPVTITRADSVMRADRAVYDHATRVLSLDGRVRATLNPLPAPGQAATDRRSAATATGSAGPLRPTP